MLGGPAAGTANNKNLAVTKLGAGTLTLSGSNTYSGTTTVGQGTLTVSGGAAIPDSSDVTVASGALFKLANNERIGGLNGAGTVTDAGSAGVAELLVTNSGAFSGSISGRIALNLFGSGKTLTLTGSNTYVGFTQVNGFTLIVDGSISGTSPM